MKGGGRGGGRGREELDHHDSWSRCPTHEVVRLCYNPILGATPTSAPPGGRTSKEKASKERDLQADWIRLLEIEMKWIGGDHD